MCTGVWRLRLTAVRALRHLARVDLVRVGVVVPTQVSRMRRHGHERGGSLDDGDGGWSAFDSHTLTIHHYRAYVQAIDSEPPSSSLRTHACAEAAIPTKAPALTWLRECRRHDATRQRALRQAAARLTNLRLRPRVRTRVTLPRPSFARAVPCVRVEHELRRVAVSPDR